ncbi:hypothetical protein KY084_10535 [Stakelama sp. CBK3Z-3]|uniref:Circumsporozoite protein n=1 Tax=Stakelama flava TaxID=2860338 RepID=A0ABS6XM70_9SPHN|nr:hypothetical protein [Stakelama flava]MBW4331308.1 hypothetical protein [Stakelama flava]
MIRKIVLPFAVVAALGVAGCSEKAQDESAEAGNAIAADVDATTSEAVNDIDAASDQAFGKAENAMDDAGNSLDNAGDDIDAAAEDVDGDGQ